jgi:hypothetical protein
VAAVNWRRYWPEIFLVTGAIVGAVATSWWLLWKATA